MRYRFVSLRSLPAAAALGTMTLGAPSLAATTEPDVEALFRQAMEARRAGEYERSIELFRAILAQRPSLGRARLELATAYAENRRYEEAKQELQRVLEDPQTPEAVRRNVRDYLTLIRERLPRRQRLVTSIELGLMYDSNASAGPGSATFPVPAGSITLVSTALKRGDWAALLRAGLTHTRILPEKTRVFGTDATTIWQSSASLYTVHYSDTNRNNLDVLTLRTGPGLLSPGWKASANLQFDHIRYGTDRYANFLSFNPALGLTRNNGRTEINIDGIVQRRNYLRAADSDRDSAYLAIGASAGQVLPGDRLSVQGGLDLFRENANTGYQSNRGAEAFVGFNYLIDERTNVHGRLSRRLSHYRETDPTFGEKRKDRFDQLVLGVKHQLVQGALSGWELKGALTISRRHSTIDAHDFRRTQLALNIGRNL